MHIKQTGKAKKTLYVHIGFFKTGTTFIQAFLQENSAWLAGRGMHWVGDIHSFMGAGHEIDSVAKLSSVLQRSLRDRLEHFLASSHESGVVSSEAIPANVNDETLQWIRDTFATRIIAAVRNPVAMRESGYQQAVQLLSMGYPWGCPAPQEYHWHCESIFLDRFASIFGREAVTVLPYDLLSENNGLLQAFANAAGFADLGGSSLPQRQNERLSYDESLFLRHSLFLPLPTDMRYKLRQALLDVSGRNGAVRAFLTIPRANHQACLRLREHELRYLGKEYLHVPDWYEHCLDYLEKQQDAEYVELPREKQRAIFERLPVDVQEALDRGMPTDLKPRLLPPLPTEPAAYALMNAWIKNAVVQSKTAD